MFSVIILDNQSGVPVISPDAPPCARCGHCMAFCPSLAIQISGLEDTPVPISNGLSISREQIRHLVLERRSIRKYQKKPVSKDILEEVLDIIRYAPSAMNLQTVRWQVLYNPDTVQTLAFQVIQWMERMVEEQQHLKYAIGSSFPYIIAEWQKGRNLVTHDAPHLLVAYGGSDELTGLTDAIIATSYLSLIAPVYDLGTCWAGILKRAAEWSPDVLNAMHLPPGSFPLTAIVIGYPAYRQYMVPKRKPINIRWTE